MPDFAVSTAFRATDAVSRSLKRMEKQSGRFEGRATRAFKGASRSALGFKAVLGGVLTAGVVTRGFALLSQGVRTVTDEFIGFDHAVTKAAAKFPEKIARGTAAFKELEDAARKVGAETQFTAREAGEGLDFLAMAGFNAKQAMAALPGVVDLATAADVELARATDIASDALGAFGLMTKDSVKLTENLTRVNDVFAKTVVTANTDMEQLFDTFKEAGPVITTAGASVETFAAMAGIMASAGIKGSKSGTALKNMFLRLASPPTEAAKALNKLNVVTRDAEGNMRDMFDILEDIKKATEGMGTAQRAAAFDAIFSKRAIAGAAVVIDAGADKLREYRKTLEDSGGEAKRMADEMRKSLENRLKIIKSTLIDVGFKFIDVFKKKLPGAMDKAVEAIRKFDVGKVIKSVKDIFKFLGQVVDTIRTLKPLLITITVLWLSYNAALKVMLALEGIRWLMGMAKAMKAAAVSQGILNAVMLANPVLLLTLAIAALIVAIALINWDEVIKFYNEMVLVFEQGIAATVDSFVAFWNIIKEGFSNFWQFLIDTFKPFITAIRDGVKTIWNLFSSMLDNPFFAALETILLPLITIPALVIKHWEPLKEFFKGLFDGIKAAFDATIGAIVGTFKEIVTMAGQANRFLGGLLTGEGGISGAIGRAITGESPKEAPRAAPNATEVETRQQNIGFEGRMTFVNPPPGAELETETTGAPPIRTEMLGENQ